VGAREGGRGGERGLRGRGLEGAGVEAQPGVPADNRAVEATAVAAGVDQAQPQRVGQGQLGELVGGGGGQGGGVALHGAAEARVGLP
jgi:hypothetical protein